MIEGQDIVCFAPGPWDDIWRNRHHIMTRLARANRILYVEPWAYLRPTLRRFRARQIRLADIRVARLQQISTNLWLYRPPLWAPRAERFPLSMSTRAIQIGLLRRAMQRLGFRSPILWLFQPDMEIYIGQFDEKLVIYHIVDEYAGYTGISVGWRPVVRQMEKELARRADLVVVTSPTLYDSKSGLNEHIVLVPNAVDYEAFDALVTRQLAPPPDMAGIGSPLAGYVGAVNDKLDLALLARVAEQCQDWSFVLVGPVSITDEQGQRALQMLRLLPHVHLLGPQKVQDVPLYINACDVCLLPYRVNEWTRNIDSLKLYEYLACGKPIVATDVPAAQRFSSVVRIARSDSEFVASMQAVIREDSSGLRDARRHIAAQHTWQQRVDTLSAAIEHRLQDLHPARAGNRVLEGEVRTSGL
jgi:glycosyltransferase involved in cell wall biosynthesis